MDIISKYSSADRDGVDGGSPEAMNSNSGYIPKITVNIEQATIRLSPDNTLRGELTRSQT